MKFIDWFAGIGGFRKGMEDAGHECVGFCEFDKYAVASYTAMHLCTQKQIEYLATLPLKKRQKEILKEEYRNGEWYADDVRTVDARSIPRADCWCFGFPCQDISVSGKQKGIVEGNRSNLFFRVMYLIGQLSEEERPSYLFIENVANLIAISGGWDFARVLAEMDRGGYDAEWQILNSKDFGVPQNRERVFVVGHLRGRSGSEVFPVEGADREDNLERIKPKVKTICIDISCQGLDGVAREYEEIVPTLTAREYKDPRCVTVSVGYERIAHIPYGNGNIGDRTGVYDISYGIPAQNATQAKDPYRIAIPVLNNEAENKKGFLVEIYPDHFVYAIWYPKKQCYIAIRKLTPKECFRLQGWKDEYFEKAQLINSNSQLYKQAGNGVTVNVIRAIAERMT